MRIILATLGTSYFWLFSPESLVIITHAAAQEPVLFSLALTLLSLLVVAGVRIIRMGVARPTLYPGGGQAAALVQASGLGGIVGTALFASTGLLVTAGFTFNEVFLYYFPNFGFAYLLLGISMTVHLVFTGHVRKFQAILVGLILCCLLGLTIYGFFIAVQEPGLSIGYQSPGQLPLLALVFIFAGFEQVSVDQTPMSGHRRAVLFGSVMFALLGWMVIAGLQVAPQKLAFSTVPYMTASAGIAGQIGRLIMGVAIVCGSLAACSGLFMFSRDYVGRIIPGGSRIAVDRVLVIGLAIAIGIAMAIGLAGESRLEIYIRGSLTLWLIHGGLSVFTAAQPETSGSVQPWKARLVGLVIIMVSTSAALQARDPKLLSIFFTCLLAGSFLCILVVRLMHGYSASHGRIINKKETLT
jgi:hypothetical protein